MGRQVGALYAVSWRFPFHFVCRANGAGSPESTQSGKFVVSGERVADISER